MRLLRKHDWTVGQYDFGQVWAMEFSPGRLHATPGWRAPRRFASKGFGNNIRALGTYEPRWFLANRRASPSQFPMSVAHGVTVSEALPSTSAGERSADRTSGASRAGRARSGARALPIRASRHPPAPAAPAPPWPATRRRTSSLARPPFSAVRATAAPAGRCGAPRGTDAAPERTGPPPAASRRGTPGSRETRRAGTRSRDRAGRRR
jgi:hypothetical protein